MNKVEELIKDGFVKANTYYGYLFKGEILKKINNLGYVLHFTKEGIKYNKIL